MRLKLIVAALAGVAVLAGCAHPDLIELGQSENLVVNELSN